MKGSNMPHSHLQSYYDWQDQYWYMCLIVYPSGIFDPDVEYVAVLSNT